MIRTFLARGDRAGEAVITDGLESVTCSNPPPAAYIATLGMQTYCSACKQTGYIAPRGPRWPGTGPNGREWALSGDINICGCKPAPSFYPARERDMTMSFTADEAVALMATPGTSVPHANSAGRHWISFVLRDRGDCRGMWCAAYFEDGSEQWGSLDADNTVYFQRHENSSPCTRIELMLDDLMRGSGSVSASLLSAISG